VTPELPFADACERNKVPIMEVLAAMLPRSGRVLEIGSGTGQHVVFFAGRLPGLIWQPSDRKENLPGLTARIDVEGGPNVLRALELDVMGPWPDGPYDAVFSANTSHIMAWDEVEAMFRGIGSLLAAGGPFCLYGPFNEGGRHTAPGNAAFDAELRRRNPRMGLRDVEALEAEAMRYRMLLERRFSMPANNQILVFRKQEVFCDDVSAG
jgi:SAM-dependent methyltransferase